MIQEAPFRRPWGDSAWTYWFNLVSKVLVPGAYQNTPTAITAGTSPYTITNSSGANADILVSGGTVSAIELVRGGTNYPTGLTSGIVTLSPGDGVKITYSVAPTIYSVPR